MDLGGFFWNYYLPLVVAVLSLVFYYHEKTSPPVLPYSRITFTLHLFAVVLTLPIPLLLLALFRLYRQFVVFLLTCKLGSDFGGVLEGDDAFFAMDPLKKASIGQIALVEYRGSPEDFYRCVRKAIKQRLSDIGSNPKTFSRLRYYLGYYYWVKGDINLDGYVKKMEEESILNKKVQSVTEEELLKIVNVLANKPLENLWEVSVSSKPVRWEQDDESYLMLFVKYNHVLSDPLSINFFALKRFGEGADHGVLAPITNQVQNKMKASWLDLLCLPLLVLTKAAMVSSLFEDTRNPLRGPKPNHKLVITSSDAPTRDYVQKIKKIKKFLGCSFMDVVLAAVSASLSDYIQKKTKTFPSSVTVTCSEMSLLGAQKAKEATSYGNYLGFSLMKIPVYPVDDTSLLERVRKIQICSKAHRNVLEIETRRIITNKVMHVLPNPLMHFFVNTLRITAIVTNIPDATTVKLIGELQTGRMFHFGPLREKTGILFAITGCKGMWQVSSLVDKGVLNDETDVKEMAEGVHKYVQTMYQEYTSLL